MERFTRYLTGTRYDRRRKLRALTAHNYANRLGLLCEWAGTWHGDGRTAMPEKSAKLRAPTFCGNCNASA